ncbi:SURF1 family protein [Leifsonia sp. A12D58]|uniref:SURF1 family protein n=1 Tax=Leifsonia sp. A12D58 TaxID=3397674 RepID=UPI0039E009A2
MMLRPRWVGALVLALAIAAAFALLGQWQLDRAIASAQVEERTTEEVVVLADVVSPDGPTPTAAEAQLVTLTGHYVAGDEQLVAEAHQDSAIGWWVVSRFVTTDDITLPIVRGWAATEDKAREAADELAVSDQDGATVTVTGRFLSSNAPVLPPAGGDPHLMTTVSVAALINLWTDFTDQSVYFGYVLDSAAAPGLEAVHSPPPEEELSVNWLNIFYAAEWIVFAGFAVFLWYRLVRDAVEREEEEAQQAALAVTAGSPPPPAT